MCGAWRSPSLLQAASSVLFNTALAVNVSGHLSICGQTQKLSGTSGIRLLCRVASGLINKKLDSEIQACLESLLLRHMPGITSFGSPKLWHFSGTLMGGGGWVGWG